MGPLLSCSVTAVLQGVSLPAGDDGSGVTNDSEIVCLSDRVMAGRHSLTHQARREEIRGEEEKGGSLAALSFNPGSRGQQKKKKLKAAINVSLHIHVHVGRLLTQQCIAFRFGDLANKWTLCLSRM